MMALKVDWWMTGSLDSFARRTEKLLLMWDSAMQDERQSIGSVWPESDIHLYSRYVECVQPAGNGRLARGADDSTASGYRRWRTLRPFL
jgi:hypothetical protein